MSTWTNGVSSARHGSGCDGCQGSQLLLIKSTNFVLCDERLLVWASSRRRARQSLRFGPEGRNAQKTCGQDGGVPRTVVMCERIDDLDTAGGNKKRQFFRTRRGKPGKGAETSFPKALLPSSWTREN